jgi:hypothetical protein
MVLFRRLTLLSLVVALLLSNTRFDSVSAQTVPITSTPIKPGIFTPW